MIIQRYTIVLVLTCLLVLSFHEFFAILILRKLLANRFDDILD